MLRAQNTETRLRTIGERNGLFHWALGDMSVFGVIRVILPFCTILEVTSNMRLSEGVPDPWQIPGAIFL